MIYKNNALGKAQYLLDEGYFKDCKTILEVGAGTCQVCEHLERNGFEAHATDKYPAYKVGRYDIEYDELPEKLFDAIFGLGVLHHLHNPSEAFNRLKEKTDRLVFIEPSIGLLHLGIGLMPHEWSRWRYFPWARGLSCDTARFRGRFGIIMTQKVIRWKRGENDG